MANTPGTGSCRRPMPKRRRTRRRKTVWRGVFFRSHREARMEKRRSLRNLPPRRFDAKNWRGVVFTLRNVGKTELNDFALQAPRSANTLFFLLVGPIPPTKLWVFTIASKLKSRFASPKRQRWLCGAAKRRVSLASIFFQSFLSTKIATAIGGSFYRLGKNARPIPKRFPTTNISTKQTSNARQNFTSARIFERRNFR